MSKKFTRLIRERLLCRLRRSNWNLKFMVLCRRKARETGEKPSEQGENPQQTHPHVSPGRNQTRITLVEGEPFRHCAISGSQCVNAFSFLHLGVLSHSLRLLRSQHCISSNEGTGCDSSAQGHGALGSRTKGHDVLR